MAETQKTETETGGRLPQPTDVIHLPPPAYEPVVLALGVTIAVVGVVFSWIIVAIGAIIALSALVRWVRISNAEMRELPLEHTH